MKLKSMILILALLVSALPIALTKPAMSTPDDEFQLSPNPQTGSVGTIVSIAVTVDAFSNLNGYEFALKWEKSVLVYKGVTWGWLEDAENSTTKATSLSTIGNELDVFEGFTDPTVTKSSGVPQTMATVSWTVVAGGATDINFTVHHLWTTGVVEIASTAVDGYFYTPQPYVDFFWTPSAPRAGETVTFNASACYSPKTPPANPLTYQWYIDDADGGTGVTATSSFATYSKVAHNITITVTDKDGDSLTVEKDLKIDRDLAMFSVWPSIEDYEGSIPAEIPSGKAVIIYVRTANIGTITEYTDNSKGDFPSSTAIGLFLLKPDGTEEKLGSTSGMKLRRYRYAESASYWYYKYDWDPTVGSGYWFVWYTYGYAPGTYQLKANFTVPVPGDTDSSDDVIITTPFQLVQSYEYDLMLDGCTNWYDDVGYTHPYPPFPGTTFTFFNGPYTPGDIANVTFWFSNVGKYIADTNLDGAVDSSDLGEMGAAWNSFLGDKTYNSWCDFNLDGSVDSTDLGRMGAEWNWVYPDFDVKVWITFGQNGATIASTTVTVSFGVSDQEVTLQWDTTGYYGTYTINAHVETLPGETDKWNTWDNNVPDQLIAFWNAYDDWGVFNTYP